MEQPAHDVTGWPRRFENRSEAAAFFSATPEPEYFLDGVVERDGGWSFLLSEHLAEAVVGRRPNTELITVNAGHWIHREAPDDHAAVVWGFFGRATTWRLLGG